MASHEHSESACSKCPLVLPLTPAQKRRTKMSITELLDLRSRGVFDAATLATQNLKLMRSLVLQDNKNFIKVWSKTSKSPVRYELGKLYFENFQSCYSCIDSQPQVLYKLSKPSSKSEKIEDALLCQSPLEKTLPSPSDHKPCLLTLTANSWLCRLSTETGEVIQKVYLSPDYKFRYLAWDLPQERFYVKSVLNKPTPLARQAGISQNTLLHFAIFHIFPLQIVGIMEINKTVFGNGVTEVNLSEGILAVSHNKSVKLYSFENLINKYMTNTLTLGEQSPCNGGGIVGNYPCGIPVNIQIKESLPVLFELQYGGDGMVEFGGFPWHYIHTPPQKKYKGTHHICSLADDTLAINGIQEMEGYSIESDAIYFHTDLSGRVLHFGPSNINMLKIRHELNSGLPCEVAEDFSITACRNNNATSTVTVTSSGRTVKRRFHQLDDDPAQETFRMLEYEDELDLLAVVAVTDEGGEGRASIRLHDNKSGELLRTIPLEEPWDETYQHELYFDRETLVHIEQKNNHFCCHVYKLHPNGTLMLYKASSQPLFQFPRPLPVDSGVI